MPGTMCIHRLEPVRNFDITLNRKTMIKNISIYFVLAIAFCTLSISVQGQENQNISKLLKLESDQYFADRDSAYLDPYYGLKKLIYGNKRFAENKSIKPRQTDADLKNNELGQKPFATIIGCADSCFYLFSQIHKGDLRPS